MIDWLGIGRLFELSRPEAVGGFFTPLVTFGYLTNPWAWTCFVSIVSLFTWRQRLDDSLCAEKYDAEKWAEYQARVKYQILPGVY